MSYPIGLKQQQKQKQSQLLMVMPKMKQAMACMQAPILELSTLIDQELEQNPILEVEEKESEENQEEVEPQKDEAEEEIQMKEDDFEVMRTLDEAFWDHFAESGNFNNIRSAEEEKKQSYLETTVQRAPSLSEHLLGQASETFDESEDKKIAEAIIGSLNDRGILHEALEEIALLCQCSKEKVTEILQILQNFDPPGVCARSTEEALQIQLAKQGKQDSLAYQIVESCFDELTHNKIPLIKKKLRKSEQEIEKAIEEDLAPLDLRPGMGWEKGPVQYIVPDVSVIDELGKWRVELNDEPIPNLRLNRRYLKMLEKGNLSGEEMNYIKQKVLSAKWLIRNLDQRNNTLRRIVEYLLNKHKKFFNEPDGKLEPLVMREVAEELEVHESTVARSVSNKYVDSPRGLLPLRSFFTQKYVSDKGESLSSTTVKDAVARLIEGEDKKEPLSDEKLSKYLKEQGIPCARRTIAKYRKALGLGTATQRKRWGSKA